MHMKIDRLIGIITILLQQDKATAPELAERFEVSRRTINRDIEDICKAGIPLVTTQGHGGGISIADGYKIDKSLLSKEELEAIFIGLKGIDSVSKISHLRGLSEKLSSKTNHITMDDFVIIDLASYWKSPLTHKIDTIKTAIKENRLISFHYFSEKGESERVIEPYRLVFKWSSWYVWGYCLQRNAFRLFKLNRLCDLEIHSEMFGIRDFSSQEIASGNYFLTGEIHLKALFEASEKYRLIEEYGVESYITTEGGRLLFEWNFANYNNMREWIFSFGDKVEVLEPDNLKADICQQAKNILKKFKVHDI